MSYLFSTKQIVTSKLFKAPLTAIITQSFENSNTFLDLAHVSCLLYFKVILTEWLNLDGKDYLDRIRWLHVQAVTVAAASCDAPCAGIL